MKTIIRRTLSCDKFRVRDKYIFIEHDQNAVLNQVEMIATLFNERTPFYSLYFTAILISGCHLMYCFINILFILI